MSQYVQSVAPVALPSPRFPTFSVFFLFNAWFLYEQFKKRNRDQLSHCDHTFLVELDSEIPILETGAEYETRYEHITELETYAEICQRLSGDGWFAPGLTGLLFFWKRYGKVLPLGRYLSPMINEKKIACIYKEKGSPRKQEVPENYRLWLLINPAKSDVVSNDTMSNFPRDLSKDYIVLFRKKDCA